MGDSVRCLFGFRAARPGRPEAMKFFRPAVDDPEVDIGEANDPVAAVGLGDADGLAGQRLADEDQVTAPFDGPVGAHPAHRAMVVRDHPALSLSRQCRLLSIGRSSLYYKPKGESAETLALMRRIDELFLKYPFYGARQMVRHLRREGVRIGRRRAGRLMRLMGLQAIYRAPRTSAPHAEHRVWPYLLRGMTIERANQVWCADITYIPVRRGFLYLVAIMDWASRYVLAWQLSNTLDARFCTDALEDALAGHGAPEIFNTDQGSQFTSFAFTGRLQAADYSATIWMRAARQSG